MSEQGAALIREYLEDQGSLRTLAEAVETADREAVLRLNRQAIAEGYRQQGESTRRTMGLSEGKAMPEDDTQFSVDSPVTTTTNNISNGLSPLVASLVAAAVGLSGLGGGLGLAAYLSSKQQPAPIVVPGTDTDTDTRYDVSIE